VERYEQDSVAEAARWASTMVEAVAACPPECRASEVSAEAASHLNEQVAVVAAYVQVAAVRLASREGPWTRSKT
jgi:hypothetical protein